MQSDISYKRKLLTNNAKLESGVALHVNASVPTCRSNALRENYFHSERYYGES